jgi:SAM-dependent methyltransferase
MKNLSGSYQAGDPTADVAANESQRLEQQAASIWAKERAALISLGLEPGARLLDLGCGPGATLRRLQADLPPRLAVGVDLQQGFLVRARDSAQVLRASATQIPVADESFDFVLLRLVLRHTPARLQILEEAARVVRRGGIVCAVDVDEEATAFDPEPPRWAQLKAALAASARRAGGDPIVGRRLPRLMRAAGLGEPRVVMLPVTTLDLAAPAFVEVMLAPAARPIDPEFMPAAEVAAAWAELRAWGGQAEGLGFALGIMAAARRPE